MPSCVAAKGRASERPRPRLDDAPHDEIMYPLSMAHIGCVRWCPRLKAIMTPIIRLLTTEFKSELLCRNYGELLYSTSVFRAKRLCRSLHSALSSTRSFPRAAGARRDVLRHVLEYVVDLDALIMGLEIARYVSEFPSFCGQVLGQYSRQGVQYRLRQTNPSHPLESGEPGSCLQLIQVFETRSRIRLASSDGFDVRYNPQYNKNSVHCIASWIETEESVVTVVAARSLYFCCLDIHHTYVYTFASPRRGCQPPRPVTDLLAL